MADGGGSPPCVLYKGPPAWGLPSISPACMQAEAFVRMAGAQLVVETCSSSSQSPTSQLPALERDPDVSAPGPSDFAAARSVIAFARKHVNDLDAHLTASQRAQLLAFSVMVESKLDTATAVSTWCEGRGFGEYKKAASSAKLPFPLSYVIPWGLRREMLKQYGHLKPDQVYEEAGEVLSAVADHLRASSTRFFFGPKPTSLDALLFGHLAFYRYSPAAAPVLQSQVSTQAILCSYLERVMQQCFGSDGPMAAPAGSAEGGGWYSNWSDAAKGQRKDTPKPTPTATERAFKRNSLLWLLGAGVAIAGYVLLSGRYIQLVQLTEAALGDGGDDDGGDDDEGDEGGEQ